MGEVNGKMQRKGKEKTDPRRWNIRSEEGKQSTNSDRRREERLCILHYYPSANVHPPKVSMT